MTGKFIALEGIDGSGKSTQLKLAADRLRQLGYDVRETREPTDFPVGRLLRQILTGEETADGRTIASLFAADRVDHLLHRGGVMDMLGEGAVVMCDRYYFSSYAYHGCDMAMDRVIAANLISADILRPDITVFVDIPVEVALERITRGRDHVELFETKDRLTRVREKYFEAFEKLEDIENVAVISGDAAPEEVTSRIMEVLMPVVSGGAAK